MDDQQKQQLFAQFSQQMQAKQAELFSDKQQYSGKTALEWLP